MLRILLAVALLAPGVARAAETAEDVIPGAPFKEGDVITFEQIDKLKDYFPPEFWENREFFFFEGMKLEVGPALRKYGEADSYTAVTDKHKGQARIGKDGALENYVAGMPFDRNVDCKGDPNAGWKIIWNEVKRWEGDGAKAVWSYTYWDRGEQLPLYYEGVAKRIFLKQRTEPEHEANGYDIFPNEKRLYVAGIEVEAPFDARGIMVMSYRYKASDNAQAEGKNDDTWVYVPDLRRVRRISTAQRTDSVQGTDFTMDDLRSFDGIPPQYEWACIGEKTVLAPMNAKHLAYPYNPNYNFGPYGFSYANDRLELRNAYIIRFDPKNEDHPYDHKDIYVDKETYEPLYSMAYDRKKELWKLIWHNHRYSEDWDGSSPERTDPKAPNGVWYAGWEGVPKANDVRVVSDIIVNVQTGTGNRIEFWDNHGMPLENKGKIRRYIDIGRLNKGR